MLRFYADKFVRALDDLSAIRTIAANEEDGTLIQNDADFTARVTDLHKQVSDMGLTLTTKSVAKLISVMEEKCSVESDRLHHLISEINGRLEEELEELFVFCIQENAKFFEPSTPLFGVTVHHRVPGATIDIEEAGKCLALRRGTATVFHLMRVMEMLLKQLAKMLGVEYAPSWEAYIRKISDSINAKHRAKCVDWKADEPFFRDVLGDLESVKIAWRNPTMHIVNHYTPDQAEDVFRAVRGFAKRIAERLPPSDAEKVMT
jgi:hypothetical protein